MALLNLTMRFKLPFLDCIKIFLLTFFCRTQIVFQYIYLDRFSNRKIKYLTYHCLNWKPQFCATLIFHITKRDHVLHNNSICLYTIAFIIIGFWQCLRTINYICCIFYLVNVKSYTCFMPEIFLAMNKIYHKLGLT